MIKIGILVISILWPATGRNFKAIAGIAFHGRRVGHQTKMPY